MDKRKNNDGSKPKKKKSSSKKGLWQKFLDRLEKDSHIFRNARRNKNYRIALIASFFVISVILFLGLSIFSQITKPLAEVFVSNFGGNAVLKFISVFLICFTFFFLLAMAMVLVSSFSKEGIPWRAFLIFAFTITIFLTGTVFVHSMVGAPNTEWKIYDQENNRVGEISCKDSKGKLVEKHRIKCKIKNEEIKNPEWHISLELHNGTVISHDKNYFWAPENVDHIVVYIEGEEKNLETGFYPEFYSEEGEREREEKFLTYFFGLLFVSLITIPQIVIKIYESLKEENREIENSLNKR